MRTKIDMQNPPTLQQHLEACLKQEGLYEIVPEDRRESLLTFPIVSIWFLLLWAIQIYFVIRSTDYKGWVAALLFMPILLLASLILLIALFVVKYFKQIVTGKKIDALVAAQTGTIGGFFLVVFPLVLVVVTGVYLKSFRVAAYQLALSVIGVLCFFIIYTQRYRVHLLIEFFRSAVKVLIQSVALTLVLLPVLLVIVLLSIFSEDLWSALGGLSLIRILAGSVLLITPGGLLLLALLNRSVNAINEGVPAFEEVIQRTEAYPPLETKLIRGFISVEEWSDAKKQLQWRDQSILFRRLVPVIKKKTRHWLALLLILTSILITLSFFLYFCLLFRVLLEPTLIAKWVGIPLQETVYTLSLFGQSWIVTTHSTDVPVAKVSLMLSVFIALASNVYSLTDESASERLTTWLRDKARTWLALGCIYEGVSCPHYQILRFIRKDVRRGLVNVFIEVPLGSKDEEVEQAANHLEARLSNFKTLIHITAFEQNPENPVYELWVTGKRWQLMHNKTNGYRSFDPLHINDDEIISQSFLGGECLASGKPIPDEWFGNTPNAVSISRSIWEEDNDHDLVLHPNTIISEAATFLDISLKKRLSRSDHYRDYAQRIMRLVLESEPAASNVTITLTFRDTGDILASAWWYRQVPFISYSDEIIKKTRHDKVASWELGTIS